MKKLALTISAVAMAVSAFAQGTVNFNNTVGTVIHTNSTSLGGGIGNAAGPAGTSFYYALFIAPTGQAVGSSTADLTSPTWTFTGMYASNTASAGRLSGTPGTGGPVSGWAGGTSADYVVAGWSASLGHDWAVILPQLQSGNWLQAGFFGHSIIGEGVSGGGPLGQPVLALFGATSPAVGTFDMFGVVPVPEPATFALAGLGAAALLIFRRRKV